MARPLLGPASVFFLVVLLSYMIADLVVLHQRPSLLPDQAPPVVIVPQNNQSIAARGDHSAITTSNIFNFDQKIPPAIGAEAKPEPVDDSVPVPTSIGGLVLVGTLVHSNPEKSVASVKTPTGGEIVGAFKVGQRMDGVGEVLSIERGKMIFRNQMTRRREFIELPQDSRLSIGLSSGAPKGARQEGEVTVISETERTIKREDLNRLTSNLPDLLQQARVVPVPERSCFSVQWVMPGSIYERLGIRQGDCIRSVNGQPIENPNKAMQMYNELKNANNISLGVDRGGRDETLNFSVQ